MFAGTAGASADADVAGGADGGGGVLAGMAMGHRIFGRVLHHAQTEGVIDLVHAVGVFGQRARGAAFEDHDFEAGAGGEFLRHGEARPAATADHDIYFLPLHFDSREVYAAALSMTRLGASAAGFPTRGEGREICDRFRGYRSKKGI